jgi:hypothetical protein
MRTSRLARALVQGQSLSSSASCLQWIMPCSVDQSENYRCNGQNSVPSAVEMLPSNNKTTAKGDSNCDQKQAHLMERSSDFGTKPPPKDVGIFSPRLTNLEPFSKHSVVKATECHEYEWQRSPAMHAALREVEVHYVKDGAFCSVF